MLFDGTGFDVQTATRAKLEVRSRIAERSAKRIGPLRRRVDAVVGSFDQHTLVPDVDQVLGRPNCTHEALFKLENAVAEPDQ
jgi:hypothetical protein